MRNTVSPMEDVDIVHSAVISKNPRHQKTFPDSFWPLDIKLHAYARSIWFIVTSVLRGFPLTLCPLHRVFRRKPPSKTTFSPTTTPSKRYSCHTKNFLLVLDVRLHAHPRSECLIIQSLGENLLIGAQPQT